MAAPVRIFVRRGDTTVGPLSEADAIARYHAGEFIETDEAMVEGQTGWHPLVTFIEEEEPPVRPVLPPAPTIAAPEPLPLSRLTFRTFPTWQQLRVDPIIIAWGLLGLAILVMLLSRWPWLLWLPLLAGALGVAIDQLSRRRVLHAAPLLVVTLLLPWFVWSQWLASDKPAPIAEGGASAPAAELPSQAVSPSLGTEVETPETAGLPSAPRATDTPRPPEPAESDSGPAYVKGQRVSLVRDTPLYFYNREYRLAKAGEEFEVILSKSDKVYLTSKDVAGHTIALWVPPGLVDLAPSAGREPIASRRLAAPRDPAEALYLLETGQVTGSAFAVEMDESAYLVTNYHLLKSATNVSFTGLQETIKLTPNSILDVAADADLVRLALKRPTALPMGLPQTGGEIAILGYAGNPPVAAHESGTILGMAGNELELSANSLPGQGGGPLLDEKGLAVGVATLLRRPLSLDQWLVKSARPEMRRVGLRLSETQRWSRCTWDSLQRDLQLVSELESVFDDAAALGATMARDGYRDRFISTLEWKGTLNRSRLRQNYETVLTAFNTSYSERLRTKAAPEERAKINARFANRLRSEAASLGRCLQDGALELRRGGGFCSDHTQSEYQELLARLSGLGRLVEKAARDSTEKDLFSAL